MDNKVKIARADLHMWEEPVISGKNGSGTIFFCGCNLGCVFCQNRPVSRGLVGKIIDESELAERMLMLQDKGANNINLVTAGHFMKTTVRAIEKARNQGLNIPIVYNTSGYEPLDRIKALEGIVDVYLPDMKYISSQLSGRYSGKEDYFQVASIAIEEMVRQTKDFEFVEEGLADLKYDIYDYNKLSDDKLFIMTRGTVVRHLILPGCTEDSKAVIKYLLKKYSDNIFISIMNQYTPMEGIDIHFPELNRKITEKEYEDVLEFAIESGLENGFFQDGDVAEESFIPIWDE